MIRIVATCKGASPIMLNPMTEATLKALRTGVPMQIQKDRPAEDVAREKLPVWKDPVDGNEYIGVPFYYLFSALNGAGRRVKNGKKALATATSSDLPGIVFIKDKFLKFGKVGEVQWDVDQRRGCLPKDGTAVCLVRPIIEDWGFTVTFDINEKFLNADTALKLLNTAGTFMGLGDYRPSKKGPYGTFAVTKWIVNGKEVDISQKLAAKPDLEDAEPETGAEGEGEGELVEVGAASTDGNGGRRRTGRKAQD